MTTDSDSHTWRRWVDLDLEGELPEADRARLAEVAAADGRIAAERRALESLHQLLREDEIGVRPGFAAGVMAALPETWWQRSRARAGLPTWALPLAMVLTLTLGAALLLVGAKETGQIAGLGLAMLDFAQVTFLAGAGMLFATWRGVGFGLEQLIADSGSNLFAAVAAVVFLNLLFISLLRRRAPAAETAKTDDG